jgi:hypothetical protein
MPDKKLRTEASTMQKMLIQVSSFKSFCTYSEVFDFDKRTMIKKKNNLLHLYANGIGIDSSVLIINKN